MWMDVYVHKMWMDVCVHTHNPIHTYTQPHPYIQPHTHNHINTLIQTSRFTLRLCEVSEEGYEFAYGKVGE